MDHSAYDPERYLRHFFLIAEPFSLTPDPEFLYLSESHADALAAIELGVMERRGLTVLTGEVGTGKTTLAHSVLAQWRRHLHTAYLRTGTFTFDDILRKSLHQFGLESSGRVETCLDRFGEFLYKQAEAGKTVVLIIDEAQNLPPEAFEQLRLLLNFETEKQKLLQMVLLGQPELERRLESHQLRHIEGRVAVRTRLEPLPPHDCGRYIEHRLNVAGATTDLFTPQAMRAVVKASGGIPRRLNVMCHNALLFAYGRDQQRVDRATAHYAIRQSRGSAPGTGRNRSGVSRLLKVAAAVLGIAVAGAALTGLYQRGRVEGAEPLEEQRMTAVRPSEESAQPPVALESAEPETEIRSREPSNVEAFASSETLVPAPGQSLSELIFEVYGRFDETMLEAFARANPEIEDVNAITAGEPIRVPRELVQ